MNVLTVCNKNSSVPPKTSKLNILIELFRQTRQTQILFFETETESLNIKGQLLKDSLNGV